MITVMRIESREKRIYEDVLLKESFHRIISSAYAMASTACLTLIKEEIILVIYKLITWKKQ